jgi:hypothetical protein
MTASVLSTTVPLIDPEMFWLKAMLLKSRKVSSNPKAANRILCETFIQLTPFFERNFLVPTRNRKSN